MTSTDDERESGECSYTPSPEDMVGNMRNKTSPIRIEERSKFRGNESLIELVDLTEEDSYEEIKVFDDDEDDVSQDADALFVLDTDGAGVLELKGKDEEIVSVATTATNVSQVEEPEVSSKSFNTERMEEVLDMSKILTNDAVVASSSEKKMESVYKISCFNCGSEHTLQQCDVPLNHQKIAANRAAHYNNKRLLKERYTTASDGLSNGSYAPWPGKISGSLREALGIGRDEIPEWVYRMRQRGFVDGYPPGYLAEVLRESFDDESLLEFYTDDKTLGFPRTLIGNEKAGNFKPGTIPAKRVIAYPGFNYYDRRLRDREQFRVPRFDEFVRCLRNHATSILKQRKRKRRMKIKENVDEHKRRKSGLDDVSLISDELDGSELVSPHSSEEVIVGSDAERSVTPPITRTTSSSSVIPCSQSRSSSSGFLCGTPVACRKEHDKRKPSLEKFRDNIVPFEPVEECTGNRGFFKTLMTKMKKKL